MKDGFTPVINKNLSGLVPNNLLKLEKEYSELQQYSRRHNVEILDLPDTFTWDCLMKKFTELCNDVGVMVETRDIEACHKLLLFFFKKKKVKSVPQRNYCVT